MNTEKFPTILGSIAALRRCRAISPPLLLSVLLLSSFLARAETLTQTFTLQNGWNAIFLEVSPPDPVPAAVFTNLPLVSVWTRTEAASSAQFIQDPTEASFNVTEWLRWNPSGPDFINTLRAVVGYHCYFLKLTNGPVAWQVAGQPIVKPVVWSPDRYNLRSFPIDPARPPTFKQFFASATALYDAAVDKPRGIYRLDSGGRWVLANKSEAMTAGAAYWVWCQGESSFTAPLDLRLNTGTTLDFGLDLGQIGVQFENRAPGMRTVTLRQTGDYISGLLAYRRFNGTNGYEWVDLPNPYTLAVSNGTPQGLNLGIRRSRFTGTNYASILQITDGQGTRYQLPVAGERSGLSYAGLWVGNVTVNAVSEPHFGALTTNRYALVNGQMRLLTDPSLVVITNLVVTTNGDLSLSTNELVIARTTNGVEVPIYEKVERDLGDQTPTPTKSEFTMRLLIHVDAAGNARLLKEVVQMWRDGTSTNDTQGHAVVDKPGSYVLVTHNDLLSRFKGATLRDGVAVGRRLSAIGFDFNGRGTNDLQLDGVFAPGGVLTGSIVIAPDYPLNPFLHRYHPDHDNLGTGFETFKVEAYAVTRVLEFEFASSGGSTTTPDPDHTMMTGVYRETLTGLHKQPLHVAGTFRLSRASYIAELNPSPTP